MKEQLKSYLFKSADNNANEKVQLREEALWIDFLTAFRPDTINFWTRLILSKWTDLLTKRSVHVASGRHIYQSQALVDLTYRENHAISQKFPALHVSNGRNASRIIQDWPTSSEKGSPEITPRHGFEINIQQVSGPAGHINSSPAPDNGPSNSESSYEGDEIYDKGRDLPDPHEVKELIEYRGHKTMTEGRGRLGISGLMKAYNGEMTFSRSWDEDFDSCISIYETFSKMCEVSMEDKLQALPVMLSGDALSYFSTKSVQSSSCDEAIKTLGRWYNSSDKMSRIPAGNLRC